MQKFLSIAGAFCGLTAVMLGAFGAHGLRNLISPEHISIWEKGVQYQIYHSLAVLVCSVYLSREYSVYIRNAALCFLFGIVCFSGSLYLLSTSELTHIPALILGPITPAGGFFFIAGWGLILVQAMKK